MKKLTHQQHHKLACYLREITDGDAIEYKRGELKALVAAAANAVGFPLATGSYKHAANSAGITVVQKNGPASLADRVADLEERLASLETYIESLPQLVDQDAVGEQPGDDNGG